MKAECWKREKQASCAAEDKEEEVLFMTYEAKHADLTANEVWYLDNGCSSHMTDLKSVFKELD